MGFPGNSEQKHKLEGRNYVQKRKENKPNKDEHIENS
jgi:hypothetical protein